MKNYPRHPRTTDDWKRIVQGFSDIWNLPHCVGAIDGLNSGSLYFNYKSYFDIAIMAICGAHYVFTFVDIKEGEWRSSVKSTTEVQWFA